jgi:hypothetical protein
MRSFEPKVGLVECEPPPAKSPVQVCGGSGVDQAGHDSIGVVTGF